MRQQDHDLRGNLHPAVSCVMYASMCRGVRLLVTAPHLDKYLVCPAGGPLYVIGLPEFKRRSATIPQDRASHLSCIWGKARSLCWGYRDSCPRSFRIITDCAPESPQKDFNAAILVARPLLAIHQPQTPIHPCMQNLLGLKLQIGSLLGQISAMNSPMPLACCNSITDMHRWQPCCRYSIHVSLKGSTFGGACLKPARR